MKRRTPLRRVVVLIVVILSLGGVVMTLMVQQPHYQGRSLESWLQQCADTPLMETQQLAEAQSAVRAIGAKKALPHLLRLVKTQDSRVKTWLAEKTERFENPIFRWRSAGEWQLCGIAGFEVLGTNAEPAVAELTRLLEEKEFAFVAARCLEQVGKAAEPALCGCLTNQNWQVRHLAVSALTSVTDDVEVYLVRVKDSLKDSEPAVRFATVQDIGAQNNAPELAVPLLVQSLGDPEDSVSEQAANALAAFGTNASSAFSALTNLVEAGRPGQAMAAVKALPTIAPAEAISVLSNAVVNGSPGVLAGALRSLKTIEPEMALEMALTAIRSNDSQRRPQAINATTSFDMHSPGLADALKFAAADSDPEISKRAVMSMRQMLNKQKEQSSFPIQIPNEPSHAGKPLSEWLKRRKEGGEFSDDAAAALRSMGTNAIPALLARLAYREPVFGLFDPDVSMEAMGGLIGLREDARPALPVLAELMESEDSQLALFAMVATLGAGADAVPCLMKGLTNRFPDVRSEAVNYLTGEWSEPFREQRKQALPLIRQLLNDPDENVRFMASSRLKEITRD